MNACGSDSPEPCDDQGHGTSVAGVAVGDDGGENQIGVAPGARWIGCRNMQIGAGTPARYVECFEFFLAPTDADGANPRPELGADVVNNSWTCPEEEGCTDPEILRTAVESLRAAGIAQSFAAGNSGPDCSSLSNVPPIYEPAFAVGATDLDDVVAVFSARGPVLRDGSNRIKPDIMAPGVGVRTSTVPLPSSADLYRVFSGTSAAAPHVAGAMALLWSALPRLARPRCRDGRAARNERRAADRRHRLRRPAGGRRAQPDLRLGPSRRFRGVRPRDPASLARARGRRAPRDAGCSSGHKGKQRGAGRRREAGSRGSERINSRPYGDSLHQGRHPDPHGPRDRNPGRGGREGVRPGPTRLRAQGRPARVPEGQGARVGRGEAVRRGDQGRRAREPPSGRRVLGDRGAEARDPRQAPRRGPHLGAAGSDSFPRSPRSQARDRSRGVSGRSGRGRPRRTERRGGREGHRPDPRSERRVPSGGRPGRRARRLRRRGHFRVLRRDPRAGTEPSNLPRREDHARGRAPGFHARDQRGAPRSAARGDPVLPQDLPRGLSQRRVPGQDRRLRGHPRGPEGETPSGPRRRARPGRFRGGHGGDAAGEGPRRACGGRRNPSAGADSARRSSKRCSRAARSRRPKSSSNRKRLRPCGTTPATSRRAASIPRRKTGPSSARRRARAPNAG